jgi:DNA-binding transcriptional regulator YdaS (Cro superfamily)
MSSRITSMPTLVNAWTASVWNNAPYSCAIFASSANGCIVPITLLAAITDTNAVSPSITSDNESVLTRPSPSTGSMAISYPASFRRAHASSTAECSTADVITFFFPERRTVPKIARLSDSVPPEVNVMRDGRQFNASATLFLAADTAFAAESPMECMLLGLP